VLYACVDSPLKPAMIVWVPDWVGVYAIWHCELFALAACSVHAPPEPNVPGESVEKTTLPNGALWAPWSVSVTVTWQLVAWVTLTAPHVTAVLVARVWTDASPEPWLPLTWVVSPFPAVYVPTIVGVPITDGVNVTEQEPADESVQEAELLNDPAFGGACEAKATVPAGVVAPVPLVSETVAVHVVACNSAIGLGRQLTDVDVERVAWGASANCAVTSRAELIVTLHVVAVPEQAPAQPVNVDPDAGLAVRVTLAPPP
jgi:hypothetical protein